MLRRGKYDKTARPPRGSYLYDLYAEQDMLAEFHTEYVLLPSSAGTLRIQRRAIAPL